MNLLTTEMPGVALDAAAVGGGQTLPGGDPAAGAAFAAQLGQAMDRLGQGAPANGLVPGLQATALSADWQVLTPGQATLDPQALAEFAKSQGIDDAAVRWLFQQAAPADANAAVSLGAVSTYIEGALLSSVPTGATASATAAAGVSSTDAAAPGAMSAPMAAMPTWMTATAGAEGEATAAMAPGLAALLGRRVGAGLPVGEGAQPTPDGVGAQAASTLAPLEPSPLRPEAAPQGGDGDALPSDEASAALAALAVWTSERWGGAARAARPEVATAPSEQAVGVPQVGKAPSPELAALLQKMVAAESGARKAGPQLEVLELDAELQSDLRQWLDDGSLEAPVPESRPASAPGTAAPVQTPALATGKTEGMAPQAPASNAAERADQLQALAQRVGQAVGQRLVSMIERGHWNVRFMLKPQQLGEIEVDLRMRSGELDAAFRATNGFTRDLLQDGLPRLREVMSSMGMDVASMHVGNGQSQRHGGNPTPAFQSRPGDAAVTGAASEAAPQAVVRMPRMGSDGLDVMV